MTDDGTLPLVQVGKPFFQYLVNNRTGDYKARYQQYLTCCGGRWPAASYFLASSDKIQPTSLPALASVMATLLGGMAKPLTLPFQWLS